MTEKEKQYRREYNKKTKYASQRRYAKKHPEQAAVRAKRHRDKCYYPSIGVWLEFKTIIVQLAKDNNMSINKLFVSAVEEKYGVVLHKEEENA